MKLEAPKNPNYAATVVQTKDFVSLAGCDNIKAALIFGNSVIVSKDTPAGEIGLFFPVETALSAEFLGANNLFRKPEHGNVDADKKGFFDQHGRVRCVKFRGHKSEGFYIPLSSLNYVKEDIQSIPVGTSFDHIGTHEICRKYVPFRRAGNAAPAQGRAAKLEDSIVDGQFRFHTDTENLRRNVHKVLPTDWISISDKWHGTSVVVAKILVKRQLNWFEKFLKRVGVQIMDSNYGLTYSSRRVIKAVNGVEKNNQHFYSEDIWGAVAKEVEDKIPNGFTLYGEIVGFTPDGSPIQGGYHYGCMPRQHKFVVYRVTSTNADGLVLELSWTQMRQFCEKYGFETVPTIWTGHVQHLFPGSDNELSDWQQGFLKELETLFVRDQDCGYNDKGTPAEGIVLRIDRLSASESYKLKNFRFLERESKQLDKGELDTETAQSEVPDDVA